LTIFAASEYIQSSLKIRQLKVYMKKLQTLLAASVCGVLFTLTAQADDSGYATVVRVAGSAYYSLGAGEPEHPLLAGKTLPAGAIIRTEDNGVVDAVLGKSVQFPQAAVQPDRISAAPDSPVRGMISYRPAAEQNTVRVTPNTTLAIDKLTVTDTGADTVSDTELNLKKGKIYASVKKLTGASQYLIKLPNGICGVRGTLISVSADGTVAVIESTGGGAVVSLVSPDGATHTYLVTPGQILDPNTGKTAVVPPDVANILEQVFTALRTSYIEFVNFSFDNTRCYVSPNHGYSNGQGQNNNNQGGNNNQQFSSSGAVITSFISNQFTTNSTSAALSCAGFLFNHTA
jgi:hypothetical protein